MTNSIQSQPIIRNRQWQQDWANYHTDHLISFQPQLTSGKPPRSWIQSQHCDHQPATPLPGPQRGSCSSQGRGWRSPPPPPRLPRSRTWSCPAWRPGTARPGWAPSGPPWSGRHSLENQIFNLNFSPTGRGWVQPLLFERVWCSSSSLLIVSTSMKGEGWLPDFSPPEQNIRAL